MIPWKGHMDLILAAEKLVRSYENVQFLFIGEEPDGGRSHYQTELKRVIASKGLSSYFCFLGFERNIKECINGLDILVNCSGNEPFGRVIVEAMALKKVVIAYRSGGPAEIVDHMRNGILVDVHNVDKLAENLLFLLQNKDICSDLGREARTSVIRRFSLAQTASCIQEIILS
jgi:glycosyltransferase involved in cell wall biosynthesis